MPHASLIDRIESIPRRELHAFGLYRLLEAGLIAALAFSPLSEMARPVDLGLAGTVAVGYTLAAVVLLVLGRNERWLVPLVFGGTCIDILAAALATHAMPAVGAGIAMMLLFNVAAAAVLLRLRYGVMVAVLASLALVAEYIWTVLGDAGPGPRPLAELSMFITSYLALAWLGHQAGQRARTSQQLAATRGAQVANLVEINELVIRRMRTGVLVVDGDTRITLANEAAALLLGDALGDSGSDRLADIAPELARRLQHWRNGGQGDGGPLQLGPDPPEVQPRFARLLADSDLALVFLDDATVVSRRAESLTLAAMGRFSASLAHEIRNPLAAISYAVQLLEESRMDEADRRLLQIIHQQCQRTNGIVESVLGMARRERANPENLDLASFVQRFVEDYRCTLSSESDSLEAVLAVRPAHALVDPAHLQQILTALAHNALRYGRMPDEPARVRMQVSRSGRNAVVEVLDRGPGIPEGVVAQLFRPFFTTSEHGTGLGLYIAGELARANQATLEYVPVPGGGACFRVTLPGPQSMLPA